MLSNFIGKVKSLILANKTDLFISLIIFLVGIIGFGLGRLSVIWPEKEPISIENVLKNAGEQETIYPGQSSAAKNSDTLVISGEGKYVASKSGSAYHLPWCPGAQKIKEENKIWFQSKNEAEQKGYKPAGNCPGL